MGIDPFKLASELINAQGVKTQLLVAPYEDIKLFDEMLRHQIYKDFNYDELIHRMENVCRENTVHYIKDQFETNYIILRLPFSLFENNAFFAVGPYLTREYDGMLDEVLEKNKLPLLMHAELKEYYCGIPHITATDGFISLILILAKLIFGSEVFEIERTVLHLDLSDYEPDIKKEANASLYMAMIEERYRNEDGMLEAVEQGDVKKAMGHLAAFQKYQLKSRLPDQLRGFKNFLIVLNTLFRRAVQRAAVHPAHIHNVSDTFARRIEAARSTDELSTLVEEMLHKYCLLVKNHSLRTYSLPIQKAINYIDFHYSEQISLSILSEIASVSTSYLSTQFKKEVGLSVIDYVNQNRVQRARTIMITTNLPIHEISEMIGILDENYFTRIFKRYTGVSPREYRKAFN